MSEVHSLTLFEDGVIGDWMEGTGTHKYKIVLYQNMQEYKEGKVWKTVQFGARGYQQYHDSTPLKIYAADDHLNEDRRKNYQARHGAQGHQERKYSAAWFSWNYLW